ncbi:MAG: histidine kinase [Dysgonamonadaceae bacterium]|nr:histidine kinase [Dysgonamonadaceae bacterium]
MSLSPFFSDPKYRIVRHILLGVVMAFVAIGQHAFGFSEWDNRLIVTDILVLTIIFSCAAFFNLHWLVPRFLFSAKYTAYAGALFGLALFCLSATILLEWVTISIYQLPPSEYGFFSDNAVLLFDILSSLVAYFISLIATSLVVFLLHWWKSGERIYELEEIGLCAELEKMRTKVDSDKLFNILDKAASMVISFPQEAVDMLLELSKSLRSQLYESDQKQFSSSSIEKTKQLFGKQQQLLNFLIESRYRFIRNLLFIIAIGFIASASINPNSSYPVLEAGVTLVIFLGLIYLNVYVLLPHLLFKNKWITYVITIISAVVFFLTIFLTLFVPMDLIGEVTGIFVIFMIGQITQIAFIFAGTTAFVFFQHWIRNERYIAQLEETTMRVELEQLQNQINPHFLFNMLNNILVLIRENPQEAVVILHKMSDMLKYQFNDSTKKEVLLKNDIQFLTDYLNLEKIRRDYFEFTIIVEEDVENQSVPPLLFIPFVENAVKHNNDTTNLSYIHLTFSIKENDLYFSCRNSKPFNPQQKNEFSGLGLVNVRRRLELLYNKNYSLDIHEDETIYTVQLTIKIENKI